MVYSVFNNKIWMGKKIIKYFMTFQRREKGGGDDHKITNNKRKVS